MATVISQPQPAPPVKRYSVDEYLDIEAASARRADGCKHEYIAGEIRTMTGASRFHNLVTWNLIVAVGALLKDRPEEGYPGDMRVRVNQTEPYYYPDMVIACDPPKIHRDRGDTLLNPLAVFEVLSPRTASKDRGEKLANYARIDTLRDYVIISQKKIRVEHLMRDSVGSWKSVVLTDLSETIQLAGIDVSLPLAELYDRIEFDPPERTGDPE